MGRIAIFTLLVTSAALMGCQKAKMTAVQPKPQAKANVSPPPQYTPPPPHYTPPPPPPPRNPGIDPYDRGFPVNPPINTWRPQPPPSVVHDIKPPKIEPLPPTTECGEGASCEPLKPFAGQCGPVSIVGTKVRKQLDVLFVVDTSKSLTGSRTTGNAGELTQIARQMHNYIEQLDPETDYRIGVLLGHGPASQHHGRLYLEVDKADSGMAGLLERKMKSVPNERGGAQGEAMLLSLYEAINKGRLGRFIRNEAMLQVIFVTDEQDVCFSYEGTGITPVLVKAKGHSEPVPDPIETSFYQNVCARAHKGGPLTAKAVYDTLLSVKPQNQLILGAVAHTDKKVEAFPEREDENEYAYGILDLVDMHPIRNKVNLAKVDQSNPDYFASELKYLGEQASLELAYNIGALECENLDVHPNAIEPGSIKVILRHDNKSIAMFAAQCAGVKNCSGHAQMRPVDRAYPVLSVDVERDTLKSILKSHKVTEGEVYIRYMTRSDVDPETGRRIPLN